MRFIGYLCLLTIGVLTVCSPAEEFQLKDGTKISGTLTGVTGDVFQVKTAYGEIQIPRSKVASITFPDSQPNPQSSTAPKVAPVIDELLQNTTYTNRTAEFQLTVPQGWKLAPGLRAQTPEVAAALQSEDETLFFLFTPEQFAGNLSTYRVLVETQYQTKFKDYEKLSESNIQLDGRTGIQLVWHAKNSQANDMPLKAVVYILPYDGRMVRLSFLTLEGLFNEALPIFEKIAASYHSISPVKQAGVPPTNGIALSATRQWPTNPF
jgi:hypothetical protein